MRSQSKLLLRKIVASILSSSSRNLLTDGDYSELSERSRGRKWLFRTWCSTLKRAPNTWLMLIKHLISTPSIIYYFHCSENSRFFFVRWTVPIIPIILMPHFSNSLQVSAHSRWWRILVALWYLPVCTRMSTCGMCSWECPGSWSCSWVTLVCYLGKLVNSNNYEAISLQVNSWQVGCTLSQRFSSG